LRICCSILERVDEVQEYPIDALEVANAYTMLCEVQRLWFEVAENVRQFHGGTFIHHDVSVCDELTNRRVLCCLVDSAQEVDRISKRGDFN
jgi:hypothetical protein